MSELSPQDIVMNFHGWRVNFAVGPGNSVGLFVNECLRKERSAPPGEVVYVWTNLELEWEEHRWLEARLTWPDGATGSARLCATINGEQWFVAELWADRAAQLTLSQID